MAMALTNSSKTYNFIFEVPNSLKCAVCEDVAEEARQHETCGQLFCKQCITNTKSCPYCKEDGPIYFQDKRGHRDIQQALRIGCNMMEEGCKWEGAIATLETHLSTDCSFVNVKCPNKCKSEKDDQGPIVKIKRKDLADHLEASCPRRQYRCQHCDEEEGEIEKVTKEHEPVCHKQMVICKSPDCQDAYERGFESEHIAKCDHVAVSCKYAMLGCTTLKKRGKLEEHEDNEDRNHWDCAVKKVKELSAEIEDLKEYVKQVDEEQLMVLDDTQTIVFKVEGVSDKGLKRPFHSEPFYTHTKGYKLNITVATDEVDYLSVSVEMLQGKHDNKLRWPFLGKISISLLNQIEDYSHHNSKLILTKKEETMAESGWRIPKFVSIKKLTERSGRSQYLVENKIYIRVDVRIHMTWLNCTL